MGRHRSCDSLAERQVHGSLGFLSGKERPMVSFIYSFLFLGGRGLSVLVNYAIEMLHRLKKTFHKF